MTVPISLELIEDKFIATPPEIRNVLKMCLCVLKLVFIEISSDNDDNSSFTSNGPQFVHRPIEFIPVAAANMLWCKILDFDDEDCKEKSEANKKEYWRNFISSGDRTTFLRKCKMHKPKKRHSETKKERRNSLGSIKKNASTLFQKKNKNPIRTIQNPVFNCITELLLSSGFLHAHALKDDNMTGAESIACVADNSLNREKCLEKDKELMKWFESHTSLSQNNLLQPITRKEFFSVSDVESIEKYLIVKEVRMENTFELMNEALAEACFRRLQLMKCMASSTNLSGKKVLIQRDSSAMYAINMLPLHYLRSGDLLQCTSLLTSLAFINLRVEVIGIKDSSRQQRLDCTEINLRMKDFFKMDPRRSIIKSNQIMKNVLDTCRNDNNDLLIGKALHGLASLFESLQLPDEAMQFYQYAIEYKKRSKKYANKSLASTLHRMGDLSTLCGNYSKSLCYYEEALYYSKDVVSFQIIQLFRSLAKVCGVTRNYEKAMFAYKQIIKLQDHLKVNYIQFCETYNALGIIFEVVKLYDDAEFCYNKVIRIMANNQEEGHRIIGVMYYNLGRIFSERNKNEIALHHYAKALDWRRKHRGDNHVEVAQVLHAIGKSCFVMGGVMNAIAQYNLSLAIKKNIFGHDNLETVLVMFDLAIAYNKIQQYDAALHFFNRIIQHFEVESHKNHPKIAYSLFNMGLSFAGKGDYQAAIECFDESFSIKKKNSLSSNGFPITEEEQLPCESLKYGFHVDDVKENNTMDISNVIWLLENKADVSGNLAKVKIPELADMYQTAGNVLMEHNVLECASIYYMKAFNEHKGISSESCAYEGDYYHGMGALCLKKDDHDMAMSYFQRALSLRKRYLGETHEKVADTLVNIGQTYKHFLLYEEALDCSNQAILIYKNEVGLQHEKVANLLYNVA